MHGVRSPRDKSPLNGWSAQRGALAWAVYLDNFWLDGGDHFSVCLPAYALKNFCIIISNVLERIYKFLSEKTLTSGKYLG